MIGNLDLTRARLSKVQLRKLIGYLSQFTPESIEKKLREDPTKSIEETLGKSFLPSAIHFLDVACELGPSYTGQIDGLGYGVSCALKLMERGFLYLDKQHREAVFDIMKAVSADFKVDLNYKAMGINPPN